MKMPSVALAAALLLGLCVDAGARAIYRCGPDGKTFSQTPCMDGTLHDSSDPRTAAQKAEARRALERERQAALAKAAQDKAASAGAAAATPPATRP